jgi:ketosteroid isomerase-like protein
MQDVRLSGRRRGREAIKELFTAVAEDYDVLRFEPQDFIASGDRVVVVGNYAWRVKATGKEFSSDFAQVYTVRDGKIVKFHEFMDTAAEFKAHRKRGDR